LLERRNEKCKLCNVVVHIRLEGLFGRSYSLLQTFTLQSGYKGFRRLALDTLQHAKRNVVILGGHTGCGKVLSVNNIYLADRNPSRIEGTEAPSY